MALVVPYAYRLELLEQPGMPGEVLERRKRLAAAAVLAALPLPLSAGEPSALAAYAALLFPHDAPARARRMAASMSSCALWALALWRLLGAEAPELDRPYVPGRAVADVVAVARRAGAWRPPSAELPAPGAGDALLVAPPEHVAVRQGPGLWVDGGQGPGGRSIGRARREVERSPAGWRLGARAVVGWVDLPALPLPREAYVPEGASLD
ncbi:MAG TPA: hypothetical protein VFS43_46765 [Polyangiaceae bacterium]|nr:hypothetical protein [Polyangiaceae bacterium]